MLDYRRDIEIDTDNLDTEWRRQAALMLRYGEAKSRAQYSLDLAKERLDLLMAQKDRELRTFFGSKKPSEASLANMVTSDPEVATARKKVIRAKYEFSLLVAAVDAFQHRKAALENLVRLFGMQYYAEPAGSILERGLVNDMNEASVMKKVRQSLNK